MLIFLAFSWFEVVFVESWMFKLPRKEIFFWLILHFLELSYCIGVKIVGLLKVMSASLGV